MRRAQEQLNKKAENRQKKRKLERVDCASFGELELNLSTYKDVMDSFDFKQYVYEKLDVLYDPTGKQIVVGDSFKEDLQNLSLQENSKFTHSYYQIPQTKRD